jgi:adenylate cyclase class 2
MPGGLEREIKLQFDNAETARRAIAAVGGVLTGAKRRQRDHLLDWPDRRLSRQRAALRVRLEPSGGWLTFKGPVQDALSPTMKVREEIESAVADGPSILALLSALGLEVWFRYEKDREEYAAEGATIAVDDTPIGTYVEIEGEEPAIVRIAAQLGRSPGDYVRESYYGLFEQHCTRHGLNARHMLFDERSEH